METLEEWGFGQYEVSNYAREGYACRHNLTYWRHEDYLGFGPSAHSTWQGRRWWNLSSLERWLGAISTGRLPEAGGELLDRDTLRSEYIYLRLRSEGIDLGDFRKRFGADLVQDNQAFIDRCLAGGTLRMEDNRLLLTREGMLLCDEICAGLE
jgi:oxygen-independent coproporphyrinogen-3 oxidase